jgi:pilus assembly protein CpaE
MPERILVVDDDQDSLKLISMMLSRQGYEVSSATGGESGLQKAFNERPDLILLDVMMPDMDGFEVCKRLREEEVTASTPIIMFTAKTLVDDKIVGFEAGATDYLTKPTHPAELAARIKRALGTAPRSGGEPTAQPAGDLSNQGLSIGFVGVKGGIGTSSLTASVGAILAKSQRTIVTDIRPGQGTLAASLGLTDAANLSQLMSLAANEITGGRVAQHLVNHSSGMRLLLSSLNPQESTIPYAPESILALMKAAKTQAYYCLYDLGAGLAKNTMPLIRELDKTIVLTEPNPVSLAAAKATLGELGTRIPKGKIRLVISNRTQSTAQVSWQEVEQQLGYEVAAIISAAPDVAYQATEAGSALTQFQPDSIIAGQIIKFVEELVR